MLPIGFPGDHSPIAPYTLGWGVPPLGLGFSSVEFHKHGVVYLPTESAVDGVKKDSAPVAGELHAGGEPAC